MVQDNIYSNYIFINFIKILNFLRYLFFQNYNHNINNKKKYNIIDRLPILNTSMQDLRQM